MQDLHAETLAGVVLVPHRLGAGAREIVGRERGLDVHCALLILRSRTSSRGAAASPRLEGWAAAGAWFETAQGHLLTMRGKTLLPYRRACWNKPLELAVQSVSHDAKPPWCQRSLRPA